MIFGIGCDICDIKRIAETNERFLTRNFTVAENEMFAKKRNMTETVAVNFAAKEAFSKALGTGVRGFELHEVEVLRDGIGKPYINLYGSAKEVCDKFNIKKVFVSLSHSKEFAAAYVVLEL